MKTALTLITLMWLWSMPVQAQNPQLTVNEIKQIFESEIDRLRSNPEAEANDVEIITEGSVTVEDAGSYFAVTLPHISMVDKSKNRKVDIGILAINITIDEQDPNIWKFTAAIPTPIYMIDLETNEIDYIINIGSQKTAGIYQRDLSATPRLDSTLSDISIKNGSDNETLATLETFRSLANMQEEADGWTGPVEAVFSGLSAAGEDIDITIGTFGFEGLIMGASPVFFQQAQQAGAGQFNYKLEDFPSLLNGLEGRYFIKDLIVIDKEDETPLTVNLAETGLTFTAGDLKTNRASMGWSLDAKGLSVEPPPSDVMKYVPTEMGLSVNIEKLPVQDLIALADRHMETQPAQALQNSAVAMEAPALLAQAGTRLAVDGTRIINEIYQARMQGQISANPQAAFKAVADMQTRLTGLDQLIADISTNINSVPPEQAHIYTQALMVLQTLKGFGKAEAEPDGQISYVYNLNLNENGAVMLNGQNLSQMFGLGPGLNAMPLPDQTAPSGTE